jgi:integrase
MKTLFRLYRRGNTGNYYLQNSQTREQRSLGTKNRQEALKLLFAENQAAQAPALNLEIAKAYLTHANPKLSTRTWGDAIAALTSHGKPQSQARTQREFRSKAYDTLRDKPMALTHGEDFLLVLQRGKAATSNYLRRLHNLALTNGWILSPILPANGWGKVQEREKRAITHEEHLRILAAEGNRERKLYYELLWLTGAAQTDGASICAENVNWNTELLAYQRAKTGEWCHLKLSSGLIALLRQLPAQGPLFPKIAQEKNNHRAAEFYRRLKLLGIQGVSLHSYRYAWAERAYSSGYEQRFAQAALGHKSAAVHHAYARNARVECPPLEESGNLRLFPTATPSASPAAPSTPVATAA